MLCITANVDSHPLTKYNVFTYAVFAVFQQAEIASAMTSHGEEAAGLLASFTLHGFGLVNILFYKH